MDLENPTLDSLLQWHKNLECNNFQTKPIIAVFETPKVEFRFRSL